MYNNNYSGFQPITQGSLPKSSLTPTNQTFAMPRNENHVTAERMQPQSLLNKYSFNYGSTSNNFFTAPDENNQQEQANQSFNGHSQFDRNSTQPLDNLSQTLQTNVDKQNQLDKQVPFRQRSMDASFNFNMQPTSNLSVQNLFLEQQRQQSVQFAQRQTGHNEQSFEQASFVRPNSPSHLSANSAFYPPPTPSTVNTNNNGCLSARFNGFQAPDSQRSLRDPAQLQEGFASVRSAQTSHVPETNPNQNLVQHNLQLIAALLQTQQALHGNTSNNLTIDQLAQLLPLIDNSKQKVDHQADASKVMNTQATNSSYTNFKAETSDSRLNTLPINSPGDLLSASTNSKIAVIPFKQLQNENKDEKENQVKMTKQADVPILTQPQAVKSKPVTQKENMAMAPSNNSEQSKQRAWTSKQQNQSRQASQSSMPERKHEKTMKERIPVVSAAENSIEEQPIEPKTMTFAQLLDQKCPENQGEFTSRSSAANQELTQIQKDRNRSLPAGSNTSGPPPQKKTFLKRGSGSVGKYDPRRVAVQSNEQIQSDSIEKLPTMSARTNKTSNEAPKNVVKESTKPISKAEALLSPVILSSSVSTSRAPGPSQLSLLRKRTTEFTNQVLLSKQKEEKSESKSQKQEEELEDLRTHLLTDIRVSSTCVSPEKAKEDTLIAEQKDGQVEKSETVAEQQIIEVEPSSILEFEMFEQQCIEEENDGSEADPKGSKIEQKDTEKQVSMVGDEIMAANESQTKEDPLETEINMRISEQQDEVKKLREENLRVMELAEECQRQLEKINMEAENQEQETHKYISQLVDQSKERHAQIKSKLKAQQDSANEQIQALQFENQQLKQQLEEQSLVLNAPKPTQKFNETQTDPQEQEVRVQTIAVEVQTEDEPKQNIPEVQTACVQTDKQEQAAAETQTSFKQQQSTSSMTSPKKTDQIQTQTENHQATQTIAMHTQTEVAASTPMGTQTENVEAMKDFSQAYMQKTQEEENSASLMTDSLNNSNSVAIVAPNNDQIVMVEDKYEMVEADSPHRMSETFDTQAMVVPEARESCLTMSEQKVQLDEFKINQMGQETSECCDNQHVGPFNNNSAQDYSVEVYSDSQDLDSSFSEQNQKQNYNNQFDAQGTGEVDSQNFMSTSPVGVKAMEIEYRQEPEPVNEEEEHFNMQFLDKYHSDEISDAVHEEIISKDDKIQRFFDSGKREVIFPNGVKRIVWPDGYSVIYFANNDIKQVFAGGQKTVYFFAKVGTTQTTYSNGMQAFRFANNQVEKHYPNGTKEIHFPDGTLKCLYANGEEESVFPDGTKQRLEKSGLQLIVYSNGQKDFLYPDGTRIREYKNGTVKKILANGTYEVVEDRKQVFTEMKALLVAENEA